MNEEKINILYVIWSLGLGGAEQVVINLVKGLNRDKFHPIVCCLNDKGQFASIPPILLRKGSAQAAPWRRTRSFSQFRKRYRRSL